MTAKFYTRMILLMSMVLLPISQGARILGIFTVPSPSHRNVFFALTEELARRGHQLTVISPYKRDPPIDNLTNIKVEITLEDAYIPSNPFAMREVNVIEHAWYTWKLGAASCSIFLENPEVNKLIHSQEHQFDAVIVEAFMQECFLGFSHKYKAPTIQVCPFGGGNWMGYWVGNPNPYSYVPDQFLDYSHHMNFKQRFFNTVRGLIWSIGEDLYNLPTQDAIMRRYFSDSISLPSLSELVYNTSLLLVNNHFSLNYPKPLVPNLVQVGGMHVKPPKNLPQDLQKYLDQAPDGVIYFSLGSILQSTLLPEAKIKAFLQVFSKLKQRVLWKWEADTLPGQPDNVKLGKWLPQSDILAHPNVILFITHGGLLSMQEAMTYGVPLLGMPVFGDQYLNVRRAEQSGYAVMLQYDNITADSVSRGIKAALEPRFRESAQHASRIFRDQPLSPMELAVYWTEYVIRHKGAPHMRSAAVDLAWYQYFLLDVIAVLVMIISLFCLVVFFLIRKIVRTLFGATSRDDKIINTRKKKN